MFGLEEVLKKQRLKNDKLFVAIAAGNLPQVKAALAEGAELNIPFIVNNSPLSYALMGPSFVVFDYLLECKADPNFIFPNGRTLLNDAMLISTPERVGLLLKHGANPNKPNKEGVTPLKIAIGGPNEKMLDVLIDSGAKINWHDKTNLLITQKEKLFCRLELRIGFHITILVALIENKDEIIKQIGLLNKLTKNMEGSASIQMWAQAPFKRDDLKYSRSWIREQLVKKITKKIDELNGVESLQKAKVGLQAIMDNLKIIKGFGSVGFTKKASMAELEACLVELNEKIVETKQREKQAEDDKLRLFETSMRDDIALHHGVMDHPEVHKDDEILYAAMEKEDVEAAKQLILAGIDPNGEGAFGDTPLIWAASKNNEAMAEMLLTLGAKINWLALSETNSMKVCVLRALSKIIFQDIDDLFQFNDEVNNCLTRLNEKTAYFVSSEFKGERANVRAYFVEKLDEKRKALAPVIDLVILKTARDRFCLIEQALAIIQSPEGEKEKGSMKQLRQWINHLNERIAKLVGKEKLKYQPGLTQFASVEPAAFENRSELGPDAGYTL